MMQNDDFPLLRLYDPGLFFLPSGALNYEALMDFLLALGQRKGWSQQITAHHATGAMQVFEFHRQDPDTQRLMFVSYLDSLL